MMNAKDTAVLGMKKVVTSLDIENFEFVNESDILKFIIHHEKARKIIHALQEHEKMYFNEFHKMLGGNRSTIADILHNLEDKQVIIGDWEIKKTQSIRRAVKNYHIADQWKEKLDKVSWVLT